MLVGKLHAASIAANQQIGFVMSATVPDRPDCVEDPLCRKIEARRSFCRAGRAATQFLAGAKQLFACCAVDGAIDAASAKQGGVSRVHYGIDLELRDIPAKDFKEGHFAFGTKHNIEIPASGCGVGMLSG